MFVLVVFVALKLAWDARVDAVQCRDRADAAKQSTASRGELKDAQKRDEERAKAESPVIELLRAGAAGQAR